MSKVIMKAENITYSYGDGTKAIQDLSLAIPQGKKIAIIGNNGSGKTTLFLHFNGIHKPAKGQLYYKGEKMTYQSQYIKNLRKNVGMVFQDPDTQLFSGSVYQDVSYGPLNLGWEENVVREKIQVAMEQTGVWEFRDKPTHFLSFGQKKRVAIAGILAMEPEVIVLDEPTAGLDPMYSRQIMSLLEDFNRQGKTVILSSHNMEEVYAWADYIFVLHKGSIIGEGKPENVFREEEVLKTANLRKPWVLEVFDEMKARGRISERTPVPKTREELLLLL